MGGTSTAVIPVIENRALQPICEQINPAGKHGEAEEVWINGRLCHSNWQTCEMVRGLPEFLGTTLKALHAYLVETSFPPSSLATPNHYHIPYSSDIWTGLLFFQSALLLLLCVRAVPCA